MTKKTNTTTKTLASAVDGASEQVISLNQVDQDAKNALLIVSLIINAFVLIGWVALQVTNIYDAQVAAFLFTR
jgi:hypothetical protein